MNQAHHTPGLLSVSAPCAGHAGAIEPGPTPSLPPEESGHTEPQINAIIMPVLLRETACVDTQKTKSLCCAAAGIISTSSAATDLQTPHDRLRQAAPPDTTLIVSGRSPAQPVKGYTHLPFYAPTSKEQAVCDCIANAIHSRLAGNTAGALATVEEMVLEIHDALLLAGALNPEYAHQGGQQV